MGKDLDNDAIMADSNKPCVDISAYKQYFRELDLEIFSLLNVGLTTGNYIDSETTAKVRIIAIPIITL